MTRALAFCAFVLLLVATLSSCEKDSTNPESQCNNSAFDLDLYYTLFAIDYAYTPEGLGVGSDYILASQSFLDTNGVVATGLVFVDIMSLQFSDLQQGISATMQLPYKVVVEEKITEETIPYSIMITVPEGSFLSKEVRLTICNLQKGALGTVSLAEGIFEGIFKFDGSSGEEDLWVRGVFKYSLN